MDRRIFVRSALAAGAGGGLLAACGVQEGGNGGPGISTLPRLRWRLVSSFPRSLDTIYGVAQDLAERVASLTDGRFQIRHYPAGELVPAGEVLTAVQNGTVHMGHSASYYFIGHNPALAFDCTVPFGLTARQYNAWLLHGDGLDLMREVFADFNILNLPGGNTGMQMGGWFRRPVDSLAALRGIKMRIPGMGGRVLSELGVTAQVLPGGEIYPALERGAIDAADWVGPYDDEKLGLHQVAQYYYYPGWWEPGPALSFYINQTEWERLPSHYQSALNVAAAEASLGMLAKYDARNPDAMQRLIDGGTQVRPFSDDVMRRGQEITRDLLERDRSDGLYRRVYDSYMAFKEKSYRWFATAELAYSEFAFPRTNGRST